MRYLYTVLFYLASPFIFLRLLWQSRRTTDYRLRWNERLGFINLPPTQHNTIWVHAVSVGESFAAIPLIEKLLIAYPNERIVVTTTTPSASQQITKHFQHKICHVYFPYDLPDVLKRFLHRVNPALVIILETELWPNLLFYLKRNNIPVLLANARLAQRSFKRYQPLGRFIEQTLLGITHIAGQSQEDADRFLALGFPQKRLTVTGNIKFDLNLPKDLLEQAQALRLSFRDRPTVIAASTHEGEEKIILKAFQTLRQTFKTAFLILVPRHSHRFEKVASLCKSSGFTIVKRSLNELPTTTSDILLGDTIGELRLFYGASDIAFVGGSLVPIGGHNLIEPAVLKLPILSGPNLQNFAAISALLKKGKALWIVENTESLAHAWIHLLNHPNERIQMGNNAFEVSGANIGALEKHLQWIYTTLSLKSSVSREVFN